MNKKKKIGILLLSLLLVLLITIPFILFNKRPDENPNSQTVVRVLDSIVIDDVQGDSKIIRDNNVSCDATKNGLINDGDVIKTGKDSYVSLSIGNDKHIKIESDSKATINYSIIDDKVVANIELSDGASLFNIENKLKEDERFLVNTSYTEYEVRGTTFRLVTEIEDNTNRPHEVLEVFDGEVTSNILKTSDPNKAKANEIIIVRYDDENKPIYTNNNEIEQVAWNINRIETIRYINNRNAENTYVIPLNYIFLPTNTLLDLIDINNKENNKLNVSNSYLQSVVDSRTPRQITPQPQVTVEPTVYTKGGSNDTPTTLPQAKFNNEPSVATSIIGNKIDVSTADVTPITLLESFGQEDPTTTEGIYYNVMFTPKGSTPVEPSKDTFTKVEPTTDLPKANTIDAGTYTIWYYAKSIDTTKYLDSDIKRIDIVAEMGKTDPTYTAPTLASDFTYDDTAHNLLTEGTVTGGSFWYSVNGGAYSDTLPQATDKGDYTIKWKIVGDASHNDVAEKNSW